MQQKKARLLGRHVRAARGLLGWTIAELAARSGVAVATLSRWENRKQKPRHSTEDEVRRVLEEQGIEFTNDDGPGVRLRPPASVPDCL